MDDNRFDTLARILAMAPTRRRSLGLLAGVGLGGLSTLLEFSQGQVNDSRKRKRKRKRKRRKDKRNRKPEQPRTDECGSGTRPCNGTCIDNARCCTDDDCADGQVCDANQACVAAGCPDGTRRCGEECVSAAKCCTDEECTDGKTCQQGSCACSNGTKPCDGSCIPTENCCTNSDCPGTWVCRDEACGAPPLYPNLRTLPVSHLSFDMHPNNEATYILRFANTVWNTGEGRLELESDVDSPDMPKPIYQNLYDAPVGGNRIERKRIASDFIFHPQHNHFHFADFAEYLLLGKDSTGIYRPMKTEGIKTSFCIMDSDRVSGSYPSQYNTCSADRQGLTPGWADTYGATLYDQWIVLGDQILPDGEFAVQSIADPKSVLDEGGGARETDNTAITYFKVDGGKIRNVRDSP